MFSFSKQKLTTLSAETLVPLEKITELDVSDNDIHDFGILSNCSNLQLLNISLNDIENLPKLPMKLLKLNLESCNLGPHIPNYSFSSLPELQYLNIASNRISELKPKTLPKNLRVTKAYFTTHLCYDGRIENFQKRRLSLFGILSWINGENPMPWL